MNNLLAEPASDADPLSHPGKGSHQYPDEFFTLIGAAFAAVHRNPPSGSTSATAPWEQTVSSKVPRPATAHANYEAHLHEP